MIFVALPVLGIETYFIIALLIFLTFSIIITLFGFLIITIVNKKNYFEQLSLTKLLKSFGIGLAFYFPIAVILAGVQIFNFFTALLPLIIVDICFLIYTFYRNNKEQNPHLFVLNKIAIKEFLSKNRTYLLILFTVFCMQYLLQMYFIEKYLAYPNIDSFYWFQQIWILHKSQTLNYPSIAGNPPGFVLFNAASISFINDFYVIYYFLKYMPFFLMSINILILFAISKKIFKKKVDVFLSLAILLSFNQIFYRYSMVLPTILATTASLIFLLFLEPENIIQLENQKLNIRKEFSSNLINKNHFFKVSALSLVYMSHILAFLYVIVVYLVFEFFITFFKQKKIYSQKGFKSFLVIVFNVIVKLMSIVILLIILILPNIIVSSIYMNWKLLDTYFFYFKIFEFTNFPHSIILGNPYGLLYIIGDIIEVLREWAETLSDTIFNFINYFPNIIFHFIQISNLEYLYTKTLDFGIVIILIGSILKYKKVFKLTEEQNELIIFIKFSLLISIIFLIIPTLLYQIPSSTIKRISDFLNLFSLRLLEMFPTFWPILFVLAINYIIYVIKKVLKKVKKIKEIFNKEKVNRILKLVVIITMILTGLIFYISNFERTTYWNSNQNKQRVEGVLFMQDYFNRHPLNEETSILLEELENKAIYDILYDKYLVHEYYALEEDTANYTNFKEAFNSKHCKYVFIRSEYFNETFKDNFEEVFNPLYENTKYVFAKLK